MPTKPPNFHRLPQSVADALARALDSMPTPPRLQARRFPAPWHVEERGESFVVCDANGRDLAFLYWDENEDRRNISKRLTRNEARRIAMGIARLPELLTAERGRDS